MSSSYKLGRKDAMSIDELGGGDSGEKVNSGEDRLRREGEGRERGREGWWI